MTPLDRRPRTRKGLLEDLRGIGIDSGSTLMVHSSLSAIGWVIGGAPTVVRALLDAVGESGTLVMTSATPGCLDPALWTDPAVPTGWLEEVREHLPVFDRATTPTAMGAIPETFRNWPGTLRSDHPLESVCARGPLAPELIGEHSLAFSEGKGTPYDRFHQLGGMILLLGVGFNRCTALHYAESHVGRRRTTTSRFPTVKDGRRVWVEVEDMAGDHDTHFPIVGRRFVEAGKARTGRVGEADTVLFPVRDLVAFARRYFEEAL